MPFHNGHLPGEAILRSESPFLLQVTSAPFIYRPASRLSGGFDAAGRYFYYARQNDVTLPAAIFRFDTLELTAEPACDCAPDCAIPSPPREQIECVESDCLYDGGKGNTIREAADKSLLVRANDKTHIVFHGHTRGPSPDTRVFSFLSPDCSQLVFFSNYYGQTHVFLLRLAEVE